LGSSKLGNLDCLDVDPALIFPGSVDRALLAAVLSRAINDAIADPKNADAMCSQVHRREAEQWLFESVEITPFSFLWLCDNLDLDAHAIQRRCAELISIRESLTGAARKRKSKWARYLTNL